MYFPHLCCPPSGSNMAITYCLWMIFPMDCPIFSHGYSHHNLIVPHWNLNNEFLFSPFTSPFYRGFSLDYPRDFPIFPLIFSGSPCLIIFGDMICTYIYIYIIYIFFYISYSSMITSHFPMVFQKKQGIPHAGTAGLPQSGWSHPASRGQA